MKLHSENVCSKSVCGRVCSKGAYGKVTIHTFHQFKLGMMLMLYAYCVWHAPSGLIGTQQDVCFWVASQC